MAREEEGSLGSQTCPPPPPRLRPAPRPSPSPPGTHRYTTEMGASMNSGLASSGERTQAAGRAGRVGAPACGAAGRAGAVRGSRLPLKSRARSGAGGFGEIGFRATKRREEKTNRKSPRANHGEERQEGPRGWENCWAPMGRVGVRGGQRLSAGRGGKSLGGKRDPDAGERR